MKISHTVPRECLGGGAWCLAALGSREALPGGRGQRVGGVRQGCSVRVDRVVSQHAVAGRRHRARDDGQHGIVDRSAHGGALPSGISHAATPAGGLRCATAGGESIDQPIDHPLAPHTLVHQPLGP
eukprot:scaffold20361_cov102-Isochrysis_galbana.AAC.11